ncbi:diphosphate--fructose-6-phosphate 1-phosphotransferase [Fimbriiglobus ruber]|uniref:Pyrophosphate--fructose 6-phosphate 1-phosphotransferase n=1 Tax=Fimbriiglobus ruber TaxID=1908690 RepID=A0A225DV42_9BACT|nr:diphosphate--fructose-6-phosphate 1-phosphotransferase [Fimbriiglobus ruber]OWK45221.1 6-phosphofructokinase [Fimbriiglobus ruber]
MAESSPRGTLAIVVGGGPAPGINGVISAVTIEAINQGLEVIGTRDGFKHLAAGDVSQTRRLTIPDVAPFYNRGGSILGTSRTNPAKKAEDMRNVLTSLERLGAKYLVTIGGDDTAYSGSQVYKQAGGKIKVAHVPKTIDNDLPLPPGIPTFGFETARHLGVELAQSLHEDAKTTTRWYLIVSMGRAAGHLALGIGKAAAATVTIISEEFKNRPVTIDTICDIIIGSMIKRQSKGKGYGLVVLAEGLIESIGEEGLLAALGTHLDRYGSMERDPFGHLRLGEIEFGRMIRDQIKQRLDVLGMKATMVDKDLGYELRCADPIPFDVEYTRNLGYGAVKFLLSDESDKYGAIVSFVGGSMKPLRFEDMIVRETQRMKPRQVDAESETYECARRYMIRLEKIDFDDPVKLAELAAVVKMTPDQFVERFGYLVK